jgi:zinc ribbon protein
MDDRHYRKRLISFVGVLGAVLAVGLLVVTISPVGRAMIGGPGSILGWAVPLASLFTIAAITWLLILGNQPEDEDATRYVSCWSCGHSVMSEWRLCPFCGAELRAWKPVGGESLDRG